MQNRNIEQATFGAGCFWNVEEMYRVVSGVKETAVGFMGGGVPNPTYKMVCGGNTGHAEVVHIEYDPSEVSYDKLLNIFWENHDPTTLNRQGPDIGEQYRSVIFYHTEEQKKLAEESKEKLEKSGKYKEPIVTQILRAEKFYKAEEYHQKYVAKQTNNPNN